MAEIGSFFLVGCDLGRVLGFGVLSSFGFSVLFFFFFSSFNCDRCLKEDVGVAKIGGFGSVEIGGYLSGDWWVFGFDRCGLWGFVGSSDSGYGGQDILFMSCCAGVDGGR